jgi:Cof subfamily protein (haloacid dehalogenase superfamily)
MDGTLLNSDGLISMENKNALKKLQELGVEVIIASGRTDLMMKSYINQLELIGNIICCNGGLVKKIKTDEIIYKKPMNKNIAENIIVYCFENKINFLVYTKDMVYSNLNNPRANQLEELNKKMPKNECVPIDYIDCFDHEKFSEIDIFKVLIIEKDDDRKDYIARHFSKFKELAVVTSAKGLLDIMASGVSKGSAIKKMAEELNIDLEQVIAFGDNYNDLEMFEVVGLSVAMGNAVEKIKSVAKFITCSNDNSGVAYAIDNLILKKEGN